jgi:uncharacterized Tic20 family protein
MMLAAYFAIGFALVVLEFVIVGPHEMWRMLKDSDPNEPSFSLFKTTTQERARRDDDHFGAWLCVLSTLFAWPIVLIIGAVFGVVQLVIFLAMKIAILLRKGDNHVDA